MAESISTRTEILVGKEGIERLGNASAVLCGCGAVGGYAFEGLVRAGFGRIRVVDKDVFSESNLNRQILATHETIGMKKTEAARRRALSINPGIEIETVDALVSEETVPGILDGDFDLLIDAIDTVRMKICLLRAACGSGIRTFSSMGAALHMDAGAVRIAPVMETRVCPIASRVRSSLRDCDASNITCVYSEEKPVKVPDSRDEFGKSVLGSMPTVPAIFGMTLANEAIRYILERRGAGAPGTLRVPYPGSVGDVPADGAQIGFGKLVDISVPGYADESLQLRRQGAEEIGHPLRTGRDIQTVLKLRILGGYPHRALPGAAYPVSLASESHQGR